MKKPLIYLGLTSFVAVVISVIYKIVRALSTNCDIAEQSSNYVCNFVLFYSGGQLGVEQGKLIILAFSLMLIVVVPVITMAIVFPLWYSSKNKNEYKPNWSHSTIIEIFSWGIPILIILVLGYTTYVTSHSMDPRRSLVGKYENTKKEELVIQAVAMDWKWVFFYPKQDIATVNEIAIPINTPIKFLITSDTVMNSFFIPELGGQIYAMGGMENRLHLISKREKIMRGISSHYSGFGFAGMRFKVISTSDSGFANWVNKVKQSPVKFDQSAYSRLRGKQTKDHKVEYFSDIIDNEQFENIIRKYLKTH